MGQRHSLTARTPVTDAPGPRVGPPVPFASTPRYRSWHSTRTMGRLESGRQREGQGRRGTRFRAAIGDPSPFGEATLQEVWLTSPNAGGRREGSDVEPHEGDTSSRKPNTVRPVWLAVVAVVLGGIESLGRG